ncbi:MAG TPA: helicase [Elusimicrobia bacterium]|nr:helicase [Elusimicrobiota bacterium]HBW22278.1 helicase [Elusimicrobiota bacterium]
MKLPIIHSADKILRAAVPGGRLVISSPAGSGKSTKVPQLLLDSGKFKGRIAVLEPRRLAARMLAARVAGERGGVPGGETGYRVRFEDRTGPDTRLVFETEGILLRELVSDPLLKNYSAIILDEFHERHIHGDLTLAACLALQRGPRPDLLVAVMSATLDEKALAAYLAPCETVLAEGRAYPVEISYCGEAAAKLPPWEGAARAAARLLPAIGGGHALIFMPGAFEINRTAAELSGSPALAGFAVMPLHGEMTPREQDAALAPSVRRKIIIATNVAETSLTIDGVTAVIDSGLARVARFDGARGINTLFTESISSQSAAQRAGRAGRTGPGLCARLWTERENRHRPVSLAPEMLRLDLSEALLTLKACGFRGFDALDWLDPPDKQAADRAENLLAELGAADARGELTAEGRSMARYPLHPRYSRMLTEAGRLGCVYECSLIAAAAQGRGLRLERGGEAGLYGTGTRSDLAAVIEALEFCAASDFEPYACGRAGLKHAAARETWRAAKRLAGGPRPFGPGTKDLETGRKSKPQVDEPKGRGEALTLASQCFLRAFPDRVAALVSADASRYQLPGGKRARLNPKSAAAGSALICAGEALESPGRTGADITLSFAAEIREEWLREAFPGEIKTLSRPALDKDMLSPVTEKLTLYRDVVILSEITSAAAGGSSSSLIAEEFISGRRKFTAWNEEVEEWLSRVEFLAKTCPDLGLEPLGEEDLKLIISEICAGAKSVSDARERPVLPSLQNWFGWEKNRLIERYAPLRLQMPGGRKAKISYPRGREPYLEAKIQDLFSLTETPRIAAGRAPLVVHILAPSMRPVQVTKDLKNFWAESYPRLRPQLARRYPKHKWP